MGQCFPDAQGVPHIFSNCHSDHMSTNLNCTLCCKSERGKDTFSVVCKKHHHPTNTHSCKIKSYTTSRIPYWHIKIISCFMTPGYIKLAANWHVFHPFNFFHPSKYYHIKKTNIFAVNILRIQFRITKHVSSRTNKMLASF